MDGRYGALFTDFHAEHDPVWQVQTGVSTTVCLVCILETLEDPQALVIKKCAFLSQITNLLKTQYKESLAEMLFMDDKLAISLMTTVLQLLPSDNENLAVTVVDTAAQLCCLLKSEELAYFVLEQVSTQILQLASFQSSLPGLVLLGRLLNGIPTLAQKMGHDMTLVDYLVSGLDYPDRNVKSAILFVLAKLCTSVDDVNHPDWVASMRQISLSLLPILVKEEATDVLTNGMGLLLTLLDHPDNARVLVQEVAVPPEQDVRGRATLCSSLRKMVMAPDTNIQIAGVRAVSTILQHILDDNLEPDYANLLLNGDIAEFLFEALATTSEQLLSSIFQSLLMFADFDAFFKKGHTLYGIDAVVRGVQQSLKSATTDVQCCGFQLLTKILSNQSSNTSLLSNSAGYQQFVQLFVSGLQTCNADLVVDVLPTVSAFLRRDHQPSPVPYADLQKVLALVVTNIKGWPMMQDSPVCDILVKSQTQSHMVGNSHMSKVQKLLQEGLEVFHSACNLAAACKEDPLADESIFAPPESQSSDGSGRSSSTKVESFLQFLFQQTDEVFLPLVMQNLQYITDRQVFVHIFSILNLQYQLIPDAMSALSFKLVSSCFLRLSLEVKAKFCTGDCGDKLQQAVNIFIRKLLLGLLVIKTEKEIACPVVEEENFLAKELLPILAHINGEPQSLLTLLMEKSDLENTDRECLVHKVHKACMAILYYSYLYNDRLVDELSLHKALLVCLDQEPLTLFPLYTMKHFIFLLAISAPLSDTSYLDTWSSPLTQFLAGVKEPQMLYTHHQHLLEWCFRSPELANVMGAVFLESWLWNKRCADKTMCKTGIYQTQETENEFLSKLLMNNSTASSCLINLIGRGGGEVVTQALDILQSIVFNAPAENPCFQILLNYKLPNILLKLLSSYEIEVDHNVAVLLQLVCHGQAYDQITDNLNLKLVHQVVSTITKYAISGEVLLASLNYLTVLLVGTSMRKDTRLLAILLSNDAILMLMQDLLAGSVFRQDTVSEDQAMSLQSCALQLLGSLVQLQAQFKVTCDYNVLVQTELLLDILTCDRTLLQLICAVSFLASMFHVSLQSPVARLDLGISSQHLARIFLSLQNIMVVEEELLRCAVVNCMSWLLAYTQPGDQALVDHIMNQPWNQLLLQTVMDLHNNDTVPPSLVALLTLFLEHGKPGPVTQKHVDRIVKQAVLKDVSQGTNSALNVKFISATAKCTDIEISSTHRTVVKEFVEKFLKEQAVGSQETVVRLVEVQDVMLCSSWINATFQQRLSTEELSGLLQGDNQHTEKGSSEEC
ncbi:meiosis inhibitor protein 1-like [Branchiostoma floridae]|uniref:Meiosis inhibitor protein 1-like n=1 Tax=Branchiostoma floridae TaxID=7739 RepID=A0A9J7KM91_BRAFL|nr:meiosis inhibitor protein 1-like [Branchiostoma floridae]